MIEKLKNWIRQYLGGDEPAGTPPPYKSGAHVAPRPAPAKKKVPRPNPEFVEADEKLAEKADNDDSDENDLIRNKYVREDTGTHETLKILDDSMVDSGEEPGLDPYNTGGFDRSRNWERRFGK